MWHNNNNNNNDDDDDDYYSDDDDDGDDENDYVDYYDVNADDDTADTQLTTLLYLCMHAAINFDTICTTICRGHSWSMSRRITRDRL
jgi:hypothetical protein